MSGLFPASMPEWARQTTRLVAIGFVAGVVGYGVGHVAADLFPGHDLSLPGVRWADVLAGFVAAVLIVASAFTALRSFNRAALGKMLKLEGPAGDDEAREARSQAAILALSGVIMLLPILFSALAVPAAIALIVILGLLALHTALNVRLYRSVDEMFRRVVIEAGALTFWLGQGLLFLWAAAERLAVAPPITAWDIYVVMMAAYLIVSTVVTMRRGLA